MQWLARLQRHWFSSLLLLVALIAAILRLYQLGTVPEGLTWDEAAIGYNGFAVVTTLRDETLRPLPFSFKSFGDYKAPLPIYVTGVFTALLGMTPWVIRLPFALSGMVSVIALGYAVYHLVLLLEKNEDNKAKAASIVAALILATTPWHLHLTRMGFESGMALCLVLLHFWTFCVYLRTQKLPALLVSSVFFSLSLYAYHSPKITAPLLLVLLGLVFWKQATKSWKKLLLAGAVVVVLVAPLAYDTVFGPGSQRLQQTSAYLNGKSTTEKVMIWGNNAVAHFSPTYLWSGETINLRQGDGAWGVLFWPVVLLSAWGALVLFLPGSNKNQRVLAGVSVGWIIIGTLPAVLGQDVPHSNRQLLALPGFIILSLVALDWLYLKLSTKNIESLVKGSHCETLIILKSVLGSLLLATFLLFVAYLHHYYYVYPQQTGEDLLGGYLETMLYVAEIEKTHPTIEKFLISNQYGTPYIYTLVARKTSPFEYNYGSLIKYEFPDKVTQGDADNRTKTVVVATTKDEVDFSQADKVITDKSGRPRFAVFVND